MSKVLFGNALNFTESCSQGTVQTVDKNVYTDAVRPQLLSYKTSENYRSGPEQIIFILQFSTWDNIWEFVLPLIQILPVTGNYSPVSKYAQSCWTDIYVIIYVILIYINININDKLYRVKYTGLDKTLHLKIFTAIWIHFYAVVKNCKHI